MIQEMGIRFNDVFLLSHPMFGVSCRNALGFQVRMSLNCTSILLGELCYL